MLPSSIKQFATKNHRGVLTCFRKTGMAQMSIVTCGSYKNGVAFSTTADRAKLINLQRDLRCSLMISQEDWWGYVVLEGRATILSSHNTPANELRDTLREVYIAAPHSDHPDRTAYDQAMVEDQRVAVIVIPDHLYGTAI